MVERLEGRVAFVTGATQAMGAGIARRLAREGAAIVGFGRTAELGERVAAELRAAGARATFVRGDVTREEQVQAAVQRAVEEFGRVDILVNNAAPMRGDGTDGVSRPIAEVHLEHLQWHLQVTLIGAFLCAKHVVPVMAAAGGGAIVNISSGAAARGVRGDGGYGMAKAGLEAFTRVLSVDHAAQHIRANTVRLGAISVPGNAGLHQNPVFADALREARTIHAAGTPDDVAAAVAFLASDDSRFITGEVLVVDGGAASKHRGVNIAEALKGSPAKPA